MKKLYMYVGPKPLELPIAVADTAKELAELTGHSENGIYSMIYHHKVENKPTRAYRVEIDEDEE